MPVSATNRTSGATAFIPAPPTAGTFGPELVQRRKGLVHGLVHELVRVVQERNVYVIQAHSLQALLQRAPDPVRAEVPDPVAPTGTEETVHPLGVVVGVDQQPSDLGREDILVPRELGEECPQALLGLPGTVVRSGVETPNPRLPGRIQRRHALVLAQRLVETADLGAAEGE